MTNANGGWTKLARSVRRARWRQHGRPGASWGLMRPWLRSSPPTAGRRTAVARCPAVGRDGSPGGADHRAGVLLGELDGRDHDRRGIGELDTRPHYPSTGHGGTMTIGA